MTNKNAKRPTKIAKGAKSATSGKATKAGKGKPSAVKRALAKRRRTPRAWFRDVSGTPKFAACVALVAAYALASVYFSFHYLPGTTINGINASWRTPASLAQACSAAADGYELTLEGDDVSATITGASISLAFDEPAFEEAAAACLSGPLWPLRLALSRSYDVVEATSFSDRALKAAVDAAVGEANKTRKQPRDAALVFEARRGAFAISREQAGTAVDPAKAYATSARCVGTLRDKATLGEGALARPARFADDPRVGGAIEQANARADLSVGLTVRGQLVQTVEGELLHSWIVLSDDYEAVPDVGQITTWARGELSESIDTVGTLRTYTRPDDGKYVEVYDGTYGWNVDGAKLAKLLARCIEDNTSDTIEIPMLSEAYALVGKGERDWGNRYLDVDLSEQYVRMFDDNSELVWSSECVSGNVAAGTDTVTGVYALEDKESPKTLVGLDYDNDGEPDYESDVTYWMPFFGGYGLHDALWRWDFAADAYQTNGSHGCVNLPYYAAELLYSIIRIGDVVVVHY